MSETQFSRQNGTPNFREKLGNRIKARMSRLQITADTLSAELSISPPTLSRIITGHTDSANWEHLEKLAHLLGWTMTEMMDVRAVSAQFTGIRAIDEAIIKWNSWLFMGMEGYKILKQMADPDYQLIYTSFPMRSAKRRGPNLKQEILDNENQQRRDVTVDVKTASILTDTMILTNPHIITVRHSPPSTAHLERPIRVQTNSMIDIWELSNKVAEIKKGQPFVITRRYIQSMGRWTESE